jgi:hypothetical protein
MDFTATWGWPQWAILIMMMLYLIIGTAMHGKPRPAYDGFAVCIGFAISLFILIATGFFA